MEERSLLLLAGLLLGVLVAALVASVLAVRRLGQRQLELKAATEVRLDKLNQRLAEYQQSHIRMGEELISLRNKLSQLENKQQRLEQQDMHTMPYNQASRLVGMGASLDDLMQSCGLTRSEAELMLKLHGNK
ncbi:chemotaxis protein [Halopseudomonas bauzanensis]|nr:chemotaxis protein [Halopseudomonas bauzanensis]